MTKKIDPDEIDRPRVRDARRELDYLPTKHEALHTYETYVVAIKASEYHGDQMGEEEKCPRGYLVLVDAEQQILGFAPEHLAHKLAKALNLAAQAAEEIEET